MRDSVMRDNEGWHSQPELAVFCFCLTEGRLRGLIGSAVSHRSIAPGFISRPGYVSGVFHLSLFLITLCTKVAVKMYMFFTFLFRSTTLITTEKPFLVLAIRT